MRPSEKLRRAMALVNHAADDIAEPSKIEPREAAKAFLQASVIAVALSTLISDLEALGL
jgi:hypothetical protein